MEDPSKKFPPLGGNTDNSTATKKLCVAAIAVIFIILLFLAWALFLSPDAKMDREYRENYKLAINALSTYENAMKNDTYGGETPQETLNLFIDALEKEDIDLVIRYFLLEENGQEDFKTRESLLNKKNEFKNIADTLKKAEPYEKDRAHEGDYKFVVRNENGEIIVYIDLELNKYSGVWKIENL